MCKVIRYSKKNLVLVFLTNEIQFMYSLLKAEQVYSIELLG